MLCLRRVAFIAVAAMLLPGALPTAAQAADSTLVLSGTNVSSSSTYTSGGVIDSLAGSLEQDGPVVRLWGDRLTYHFIDNGRRIDATSWGHSLSLGYRFADQRGWETAFVGVDTRSTNLAPFANSVTEGTHTGARFELDAVRSVAQWFRVGATGSETTAADDYWARAEAIWGPENHLQFGPQFAVFGNPDYHGARGGAALENIGLSNGLHAAVSAGVQRTNQRTGIYAGVAVTLTSGR